MRNNIEDELMNVLDKISRLNRTKYKNKSYINISKEDISTIMGGILYYKLKIITNDIEDEDEDEDDYDD